jgi:malic enzyme
LLFPSVSRLRDVSFEVAMAVAREAIREGVASLDADGVERAVRATMWDSRYPSFEAG